MCKGCVTEWCGSRLTVLIVRLSVIGGSNITGDFRMQKCKVWCVPYMEGSILLCS